MALGVGIFCPEGGTEGIHIAEGHGEVFGIELAGNGEAGLLAEEVLAVIHLPVLGPGHIVQIQRGHLEHFACALAVRAGDDGGLHVYKAPLLEKLMHGVSCHGAHTEGGREKVGPGPQMLDGPQELHAVALFLQGIIRSGLALHFHAGCLHLQRLLGLRGQHHSASDDESGAHILPGDLLIIVQHGCVQHHLQVLKAGAVIQLHKAKALHIPDGACPAAYHHFLAAQALTVGKQGGDSHSIHSYDPPLLVLFLQYVSL